MSRRGWMVVAAFLLAAGAGVAARVFLWPAADPAEQETVEEAPAVVTVTETLELEPAELYFPSLQGGLRIHRQALPVAEPLERIRSLVETLIEGPGGVSDGDLYSPLPESTVLESVYFLDEGTVALDLRSHSVEHTVDGEIVENAAGENAGETDDETEELLPTTGAEQTKLVLGSEGELLALYSLVNTVALSGIEGAERVVLLWDGRQPETFAGHVDVSRPLPPDTSWVIDP